MTIANSSLVALCNNPASAECQFQTPYSNADNPIITLKVLFALVLVYDHVALLDLVSLFLLVFAR